MEEVCLYIGTLVSDFPERRGLNEELKLSKSSSRHLREGQVCESFVCMY